MRIQFHSNYPSNALILMFLESFKRYDFQLKIDVKIVKFGPLHQILHGYFVYNRKLTNKIWKINMCI